MNKTIICAVVVSGLLGLATAIHAGETFQENFETGWTNNAKTNLMDSDGGGYPSNWNFRLNGAGMWSVVDSGGPQKKVLQFKGGSFCTHWWTGGGQHGVTYSTGKTLQLDGWIRQATPTGVIDIAYLWLSTPEHNGYGFLVHRSNNYEFGNFLNDNKNYTAIFKFRDGVIPFGDNGTVEWKNREGERPNDPVAVETANDGYLHFFLKLTQSAAGAPVQISLYYKDTTTPPVMTWTDDGSKFGAILDVSKLTWVGVTAQNGKDIPHPMQFDAIGVALVPNP